MTAAINTRLALFGIGMFAALSGSSHAASYAEYLFGEKFEAHIREMVADGITRKDAGYIAYAALARGSYELCGDHLFPKSLAYGSYLQSLKETSLPQPVVDRHMRAFENIMKAEFQNERELMRYCGSRP
ncbi:hypothetical protein CU102_00010 [Phyllobacterium brassicacearum]|uniref:Rap1a immunity protein domain-containing protein n=1 Tax=Phyllobacterium brassicacearum TaxID=314235 RepID=A0A2P7BVN4_9HYPH|nr:hypothetical protein [Phyllobacterium brassicacearum]PSH70492.1 hypothetical protein CU102_00010 [Phyllobacterium brassicacearum]TDQ36069.1 hypothetical protein DEV91_101556 [Phyllobacterium brassicacearum]